MGKVPGRRKDTDRPYREGAAAILQQLPEVALAEDHEAATQAEGAHDVEVTLATGRVAAVEVTRLVDGPTLATYEFLRRRGRVHPIAALGTWEALLGDTSPNVKQLVGVVGDIVAALEAQGVSGADPLTWTFEPASAHLDWSTRRSVFERLEPFGLLDLRRTDRAGGSLIIEGPVYGGIASASELTEAIADQVERKAPEVRGRGDEAWVFVWADWTNVLPGRVLRPGAPLGNPDIALPVGIQRVIASVIAFDQGEQRLPVAQWFLDRPPSRSWVRRATVDECFRRRDTSPGPGPGGRIPKDWPNDLTQKGR